MDTPLTPQEELEQVLVSEQKLRDAGQAVDVKLLLRRAELLSEMRHFSESLAVCEEIQAIHTENDSMEGVPFQVLLAANFAQLGRLDKSLAASERAEQLCREQGLPVFPGVALNRGNIYRLQGRFQEALAAYAEAERLHVEQGLPVQPTIANSRGNVFLMLGQYQAALAAYAESERLHREQGLPVFPGIAANRGMILSPLGRYEEALAAYAESERLHREQDLPLHPGMVQSRGNVFQSLGRYEEALECFAEAERLFVEQGLPVYPGIAGSRGIVFHKQGQFEKALAAFADSERQFIEQGLPVWPGIISKRAAALGKLGQYEAALAAFAESERMQQEQGIAENWSLYFDRAITMYEAGHHAEAIDEAYRSIVLCGERGIKQPGFVKETLRDWMSPKPEKLVAEQLASQPQAVQPVPDNEKKHDVFICYRRDPGQPHSMLLQAHMELHGKTVFRDQDGLSSGRFEAALLEAIRYSRHMVILLTPDFFDRCCSFDGDVVRQEIATALHFGTHIIPVKMEGFSWPASAVLPEDICDICGINAMSHSSEFYTAFIDKLLKWMGE